MGASKIRLHGHLKKRQITWMSLKLPHVKNNCKRLLKIKNENLFWFDGSVELFKNVYYSDIQFPLLLSENETMQNISRLMMHSHCPRTRPTETETDKKYTEAYGNLY